MGSQIASVSCPVPRDVPFPLWKHPYLTSRMQYNCFFVYISAGTLLLFFLPSIYSVSSPSPWPPPLLFAWIPWLGTKGSLFGFFCPGNSPCYQPGVFQLQNLSSCLEWFIIAIPGWSVILTSALWWIKLFFFFFGFVISVCDNFMKLWFIRLGKLTPPWISLLLK